MKYREVIKIIEEDGWFIVRFNGSHKQFKHKFKKGTVTIAGKSNKDVPKGTLNNIFKQASLKD